MRLLLVDSDSNFRRALAIALRLDGLRVHEAEDLPTAEALAAALPFDAAILHLTEFGGHAAFAALLRERSPDCRLVICHAHREILAAARAEFRGPVVELLRPFGARELLSYLRS